MISIGVRERPGQYYVGILTDVDQQRNRPSTITLISVYVSSLRREYWPQLISFQSVVVNIDDIENVAEVDRRGGSELYERLCVLGGFQERSS